MTASTNMKLVLIPGNEYGSIPSKNKSDFSYLTHHFCSIDFNYEFALQQIHTIDVANTKLSKILLDGALGEVIVLTDVDGILEKIQKKYKKQPINTIDGVKIEFEKEWVHLRKSNTEPIIRIYSESDSEAKAEHLAKKIMQDIKEVVNATLN